MSAVRPRKRRDSLTYSVVCAANRRTSPLCLRTCAVSGIWVFPKGNPWICDCICYLLTRVNSGKESRGYFLSAPKRDVSGLSSPPGRPPSGAGLAAAASLSQPPARLVEIIRLGAAQV